MSILLLLIPLGLVLVAIALWAFVWAVNHDQFDDLDRAAHSILFDDDVTATRGSLTPRSVTDPADRAAGPTAGGRDGP